MKIEKFVRWLVSSFILILVCIMVVGAGLILTRKIDPIFEYYQLEGIVILIFSLMFLNATLYPKEKRK